MSIGHGMQDSLNIRKIRGKIARKVVFSESQNRVLILSGGGGGCSFVHSECENGRRRRRRTSETVAVVVVVKSCYAKKEEKGTFALLFAAVSQEFRAMCSDD